jgi:hypothetical protein
VEICILLAERRRATYWWESPICSYGLSPLISCLQPREWEFAHPIQRCSQLTARIFPPKPTETSPTMTFGVLFKPQHFTLGHSYDTSCHVVLCGIEYPQSLTNGADNSVIICFFTCTTTLSLAAGEFRPEQIGKGNWLTSWDLFCLHKHRVSWRWVINTHVFYIVQCSTFNIELVKIQMRALTHLSAILLWRLGIPLNFLLFFTWLLSRLDEADLNTLTGSPFDLMFNEIPMRRSQR